MARGQHSDPDSTILMDDRVEMYTEGNSEVVAYAGKDVEARAEKTYRPGNERFN